MRVTYLLANGTRHTVWYSHNEWEHRMKLWQWCFSGMVLGYIMQSLQETEYYAAS